MAGSYPEVQEVFEIADTSVRAVAQRVALSMTQTGEYELVNTEPGVLVFERVYGVRWAAGLLQRSEKCTVSFRDAPGRRLRIGVEGNLAPDRLVALKAAVYGDSMGAAALESALGAFDVMPEVGDVGDGAVPAGRDDERASAAAGLHPEIEVAQSPPRGRPVDSTDSFAPPADDAPTPPGPAEARATIGSVPTTDPRSGAGGGLARPVFRLSAGGGDTWMLAERTSVGRDPTSSGARATWSVTDGTVSKTHCWIEPAGDGVSVCDLASTNGTRVVDQRGRTILLAPNAPTFVPAGTRILLGDLELLVERLRH